MVRDFEDRALHREKGWKIFAFPRRWDSNKLEDWGVCMNDKIVQFLHRKDEQMIYLIIFLS